MRQKVSSGLLLAVSVVVSLIFGEVILRAFAHDQYYVWPPNLTTIFKPRPEIMPGISGDSYFVINESGMRGDPFPKDSRYRILTIGGSTTECLYLDQSEAWPQLLQDKLNSIGESAVWVGNVGKSGHNTREHLLQVEMLLEQYPDIRLVVLLIGANDLLYRLSKHENFRLISDEEPEYSRNLLHRAFAVNPRSDQSLPFVKRTEIWKLLRQVKQRIVNPSPITQVQDDDGSIYIEWRKNRKSAATILDTVPNLSKALEEYEQNINGIIDLANERKTKIVFMTQPVLWRQDLPEALSDLLWTGGIGDYQKASGKQYYSAGALADAMKMYNEALIKVCDLRKVDCLDLASLVPKDLIAFYDDVHFNENGARILADSLSKYLIEIEAIELHR